ncbi:hypothetical protein CERZMDRAFT_119330 [Cercospora zeae-maydis SCOH1-5]|uniref:Mid2 domain-containing protein n=1 Tax=Cercospora zeae-maydis SCOH1-5 TaxID=717836 RepID=A0A6A6F1X4_9PEZI|nr:hypothetical protein CERZMDRAFT_119330 [Cercospora zeae-maydis SCOH1-5]
MATATATATETDFHLTVWRTAYVTIHIATVTRTGSVIATSSTSRIMKTSDHQTHPTPTLSLTLSSSHPANLTNNTTNKFAPTTRIATNETTETSSPSPSLIATSPALDAVVSASPANNATMPSSPDGMAPEQKRAVVGGLSGTIAGLVIAGLLLFLVLRKRRKKREAHDTDVQSVSEKGESPDWMLPKFSGLVSIVPVGGGGKRDSRTSHVSHARPPSTTTIAVDEDHRMIRMSTRHWPRPFAGGEGEGYRDSVPAGQLRVVNPDLSRPDTPRRNSTDTAASYFRKQSSAFAGFVFNLPRSARQSRMDETPCSRDAPTIKLVDPTLSRQSVVAPSSRSYPSMVSLPMIRQQPPDDPFVARTWQPEGQQHAEASTLPTTTGNARQPVLRPLQIAAGSATKTFSNLSSNLLQSLRPKTSDTSHPTQKAGHISTSTWSSHMSRTSRRSDPFDLDRPSLRGSHMSTNEQDPVTKPGSRFSAYEGT